MTNRDEKEEQPKIVYTPGFYDTENRVVFEQVDGQMYAISKNAYTDMTEPQLDIGYSIGDQKYMPRNVLPWPLAEKPQSYGSLSELWRKVRCYIWEHFYVADERIYDVLTSWVFATYVPEVWRVVPYLFFHGPVSSGKTRGMEVLHRLCYRGLLSSNISVAALFRAVAEWKPVVFLDESEIYNSENKGEIIGLLNSGYRRGQVAIRVKHTDQGEELECFDVFGFKVLAGTEGFRDTLESRCIMIKTIKNRRKVRFFLNETLAGELRSMLLTWRMDYLADYREPCEPYEPCEPFLEGVQDARVQELFQSLIMISNDGRANIQQFAESLAHEKLEERQTSLDSEIVEELTTLDPGVSPDGQLFLTDKKELVMLTKTITDKYNATREEPDKISKQTAGTIIKRLGFSPRHTREGNGWLYDAEQIERLKAIYQGGSGEGSQPSQPSQGSPQAQLFPETVQNQTNEKEPMP